jgi:hypothetical protein
MTNANRNKEYLAKDKKECHYCLNKGRDVKLRILERKPGLLKEGVEICNNCFADRSKRWVRGS